jgi:hypothetical protein
VAIVVRGPNYKPPAGGDPALSGPPPPKPCPEADRLIAESLALNGHAQAMTGRANEANAEVIRLAEEARDALLEALGLDPATKASEKYVEETVAELDALTKLAARKRLDTADMDRTEVLTLFRLKRYFQRFQLANKVLERVALAKGLYLLGLAAQKGVKRDTYRRNARETLARSELLRSQSAAAFQRCQAGAAAARARATALQQRPGYTRLARARRPPALQLTRRSGLPRGALNALMAGEQEANALQGARRRWSETRRRSPATAPDRPSGGRSRRSEAGTVTPRARAA